MSGIYCRGHVDMNWSIDRKASNNSVVLTINRLFQGSIIYESVAVFDIVFIGDRCGCACWHGCFQNLWTNGCWRFRIFPLSFIFSCMVRIRIVSVAGFKLETWIVGLSWSWSYSIQVRWGCLLCLHCSPLHYSCRRRWCVRPRWPRTQPDFRTRHLGPVGEVEVPTEVVCSLRRSEVGDGEDIVLTPAYVQCPEWERL